MSTLGSAYFEYARTQKDSRDPVSGLLGNVWSRATARPDRQELWTPHKPQIGHDDVISYVAVTDLLGGLVVSQRLENGTEWFSMRKRNGETYSPRDYCAEARTARTVQDLATYEPDEFLDFAEQRGWNLANRAVIIRQRLLGALRPN